MQSQGEGGVGIRAKRGRRGPPPATPTRDRRRAKGGDCPPISRGRRRAFGYGRWLRLEASCGVPWRVTIAPPPLRDGPPGVLRGGHLTKGGRDGGKVAACLSLEGRRAR